MRTTAKEKKKQGRKGRVEEVVGERARAKKALEKQCCGRLRDELKQEEVSGI